MTVKKVLIRKDGFERVERGVQPTGLLAPTIPPELRPIVWHVPNRPRLRAQDFGNTGAIAPNTEPDTEFILEDVEIRLIYRER